MIGLHCGEAETIAILGPGKDIPKLDHVLRCLTEVRASLNQALDGGPDMGVFRIIALRQAKQDIGVEQMAGHRNRLVVVLVDHLAGEGLARHGRNFFGKGGKLVEPFPKLRARPLPIQWRGCLFSRDAFGKRQFQDLGRRLVGMTLSRDAEQFLAVECQRDLHRLIQRKAAGLFRQPPLRRDLSGASGAAAISSHFASATGLIR
jgi:hypothetical protein